MNIFETFRMMLINYREAVYLIFALGALWGIAIIYMFRMILRDHKIYMKTNKRKEI